MLRETESASLPQPWAPRGPVPRPGKTAALGAEPEDLLPALALNPGGQWQGGERGHPP